MNDRRGTRSRQSAPVAIADVELSSLDEAVRVDASQADICIRLHGDPIGVLRMPDGKLDAASIRQAAVDRFTARILERIARRCVGTDRWRLADPVSEALCAQAPAPADTGDVTVVVCTRDRTRELYRALASLVPAAAGARILVIDNSVTASAQPAAERFPVRVVHEPLPGLDRARNRGITEASSPIIAFTDDDATVDAGWVQAIAGAFSRNPDASAVTGLVLPATLETDAQQHFERYLGFGRGFERTWHHAASGGPIAAAHGNTGRLGTGANMAFRKSVLERIGGFDPALDAGTMTGGAGDLEIFFRVLKGGGLLVYEPAVVIRHEHRRDMDALADQIESWGTGMGAYLASIAAAFPEEATGADRLRRKLLMTWFARRWMESRLFDRDRHALVRREIAGLARGAVLYHEATGGKPNARPFESIHAPAGEAGGELQTVVHADLPIEALRGIAATTVKVDVRLADEPIGVISLPAIGGMIGADRLRDAIASRFATHFIGPIGQAAARLRDVLGHDVRSVISASSP